ncbi:MAG: hypothetical protein LBL86_07260 [Coriobacteriales bacterium]|jgi:hypothetical protein|nr:hypothetical protein [Coriobacteriales bacterium]
MADAAPVPLRSFGCRECGRAVAVTDGADRRTVFCCAAHEREWWRRATRHAARDRARALRGARREGRRA